MRSLLLLLNMDRHMILPATYSQYVLHCCPHMVRHLYLPRDKNRRLEGPAESAHGGRNDRAIDPKMTPRLCIKQWTYASCTQAAATIALVDATAGMIFFTLPMVFSYVKPEIQNISALTAALSWIHIMCDRLSLSTFVSTPKSASHCCRILRIFRASTPARTVPSCIRTW